MLKKTIFVVLTIFGFNSVADSKEALMLNLNKLMEIVVDEGNKEVASWFQDYVLEEVTECAMDETSLACFKVFCRIGKGMDDDIREGWINIDSFFNYIDDIIDEGTNGAASPGTGQWDTDLIEEADDITDFYEQLCNSTW